METRTTHVNNKLDIKKLFKGALEELRPEEHLPEHRLSAFDGLGRRASAEWPVGNW